LRIHSHCDTGVDGSIEEHNLVLIWRKYQIFQKKGVDNILMKDINSWFY